MNYENINNSNLDGMSFASFCQSRAVLIGSMYFKLWDVMTETIFSLTEILLLGLATYQHNHNK